MLVERRAGVVPKNDLIAALRPEALVGESRLSQIIFLLRKALGRIEDGHEYIDKLSKRTGRISVSARMAANESSDSMDVGESLYASVGEIWTDWLARRCGGRVILISGERTRIAPQIEEGDLANLLAALLASDGERTNEVYTPES